VESCGATKDDDEAKLYIIRGTLLLARDEEDIYVFDRFSLLLRLSVNVRFVGTHVDAYLSHAPQLPAAGSCNQAVKANGFQYAVGVAVSSGVGRIGAERSPLCCERKR
jgi:hypothetical protein